MKRISMSASIGPLSPPFLAVLVPAVNSEVRQVHEDLFDGRCFVVTQAVELPFVENERFEVAADLDLAHALDRGVAGFAHRLHQVSLAPIKSCPFPHSQSGSDTPRSSMAGPAPALSRFNIRRRPPVFRWRG